MDQDAERVKLSQRTSGSLIQTGLLYYPGLAKICWEFRLVSVNELAVFDSKGILLKMNGLENKRLFNGGFESTNQGLLNER